MDLFDLEREVREARARTNIFRYLWAVFLIVTVIILSSLFFCQKKAHAAEVPANIWQGLIGEAVSEGPQGMYAVACCVRNRINAGMDHGLCALKRKNLQGFVRKEGGRNALMAKTIAKKVFKDGAPDITGGAVYFENIERYGMPSWAKTGKVKKTIKIGSHTFFRRVK
jgi:hypothetical protein